MVKPCSNIMDPTSTVITSDSTEHKPSFSEPACSNKDPNRSSKMYKGVRKRKWGKWVSEIRLPNSRERIWLGSYDTQEKAARAFDAALYCLRGSHANFNFPDTPLSFEMNINSNVAAHRNSTNNSLSHQEIQKAAAKFANDVIQVGDENNNNNNSSSSSSQQEEEEPLSSAGSQNVCANSTNSLSPPVHDYGGGGLVDHAGDMRAVDWTFLNVLDHDTNYNNVGAAGYDYFGVYSGLDKMHYSGDLLYNSTTPPTFFVEDDNGEDIEGGDAFSNHSFLWSWNF